MPLDGPRLDLTGMPHGLCAQAVQITRQSKDGTAVIVLEGGIRLRTHEVLLSPLQPPATIDLAPVSGLTRPGDRSFVLGSTRHGWSAIQQRFGSRAWDTAVELTRAGAVTLLCHVVADLALGPPIRWYRTDAAARLAEDHSSSRTDTRQSLRDQLQSALDSLKMHQLNHNSSHRADVTDDDLAALGRALHHELRKSAPAPKRSLILAAITHDLCEGIVHLNARAFSQSHTGNTKTWDGARAIAHSAGIPPSVPTAIGLRRSSLIGLGGAITARLGRQSFPFSLFEEPVLLAAEQPGLRCQLDGARLVIVENLQAAQTLCTTYRQASGTRDIGVVYSGGMPSPAVLRHIATLAEHAQHTVIGPDADLGGVRIATAIHDALPTQSRARSVICDAGATDHTPQPRWPSDSCTWEGLRAALHGPVSELAQSCLSRGYPVEQEAAIVHSINAHL
ncbi:hypothetical protein WKI65_33175 [Streptomyces sp. MS1.AVA.3]|uniref:hypothetical protein n=1 Tax=Streptomyces decoyicus TaxID=249567 RepID=UPI0030BC83E0